MDDTRKQNKPMELYIGKKFKFEVWETCIKSMKLHEVASFTVHPVVSCTTGDRLCRAFVEYLVYVRNRMTHDFLSVLFYYTNILPCTCSASYYV